MNSTGNSVGSTYNFKFIVYIERIFVYLIKRFLGMQIWAFTDIQKRAKIIEFLSLTPFIFGSTQPQFSVAT